MRFSKAIIAALSISMVSTPVLAQSAAPLSIAGASRMGAPMAGASNIDEDNLLLPGAILLAVIAAIILYSGNRDSDLPQSA